MNNLTKELHQLSENEPDVALILDIYGEIERVYHDALEAMGATRTLTSEVRNSAEVTISFHPTPSSSGQ